MRAFGLEKLPTVNYSLQRLKRKPQTSSLPFISQQAANEKNERKTGNPISVAFISVLPLTSFAQSVNESWYFWTVAQNIESTLEQFIIIIISK